MATALLGLKREKEKGMAAYSTASLPLGFQFNPTDEQLVYHYLRLKNEGRESEVQIIGEVDFYDYEPWDLPDLSVIKSDQREWFFFCRHPVQKDETAPVKPTTSPKLWPTLATHEPLRLGLLRKPNNSTDPAPATTKLGTKDIYRTVDPLSSKKKKVDPLDSLSRMRQLPKTLRLCVNLSPPSLIFNNPDNRIIGDSGSEITGNLDNKIYRNVYRAKQLVWTTIVGYWESTGKDRSIWSSELPALQGWKKTMVFYKGHAPHGTRTNWSMHEYSATKVRTNEYSATKGDLVETRSYQDDFVLCRLLQEGRLGDIKGDKIHHTGSSITTAFLPHEFGRNRWLQKGLLGDIKFKGDKIHGTGSSLITTNPSYSGVSDLSSEAVSQERDVTVCSPKARYRFICEICNIRFRRHQALQLHRRVHDLQWKLPQRTNKDLRDLLNESLPEVLEFQGEVFDVEAIGMKSNSGEIIDEVGVEFKASGPEKKFEIEEIGREPETSDMDRKTFSMGLEICSDTIIQSEVLQSCFMWGGLGLTEPPKDEDWKNAKKIYLMDNELSDLPKNPRSPVLSTLFLQRNYKLRMIPPSFFDHMPALQILNLSRTGIKSLPESILKLVSLKRLFLNDCHRFMILSPKVGELERLEVLDLEGTDIMDLPMEIKELTNLTCLEVSFCAYLSNVRRAMQSDVMVPCGIISALSHIEELNMSVNPDDKRWNACVEAIVTEVCSLERLNALKFYFPRVELVRHFLLNSPMWVHPSLSNFRFTVGHHVKRSMPRLPRDVEFELERWERCLKYINGVAVPREIKKVLQYSTAFFLERHATVKKLSEFGIGNMKQLKCCVVGECNEVEVIIDATNAHEEDDEADAHEGDSDADEEDSETDAHEEDDEVEAYREDGSSGIVSKTSGAKKIVLGSLEYLYISYMKNLRRIWEGPVQPKCLSLLKSMTLRTCPELTTIFTTGLLHNLYNLEELTVEDCPSIKTLVSCKIYAEPKTSNFLPSLKRISLHYMPGLVSISSGLHIAPRLEWLSFYNCPNLKHLLIEEVSSKDLKKIKGEWNWWVALKWRSGRPSYLDDIFVPINI